MELEWSMSERIVALRARAPISAVHLLEFSIYEQLPRKIVKRFRGGLVSKAHGLLYHSNLGSRAIKNKRTLQGAGVSCLCGWDKSVWVVALAPPSALCTFFGVQG